MSATDNTAVPLCPSAQPDMAEARVFGLLDGSADEPRIAYLKAGVAVDLAKLPSLGVLQPTEAFTLRGAVRAASLRALRRLPLHAREAHRRVALARRGLAPTVQRSALLPVVWRAGAGGLLSVSAGRDARSEA